MDRPSFAYGQCIAHGSSTNLLFSNYIDTVTTTTKLGDHQTRQHEPRTNFLQR